MNSIFNLTFPNRLPITELDDIRTLFVPLTGHEVCKYVKKRSTVMPGALLGIHQDEDIPDVHAPKAGIIKNITRTHIELDCSPEAEKTAKENAQKFIQETVEKGENIEALSSNTNANIEAKPINLLALNPQDLIKKLKTLGISVRPFTRPCTTFILNGLNPEPGICYAEELLLSYSETIKAAFPLIQRLSSATNFILALPEGNKTQIEGFKNHFVKAVYPISLARPLITNITKTESSKDVTLVHLNDMFNLGLVAQTGLPLNKTIISVQNQNFFTSIGTPVRTLLEKVNITPQDKDSIILGGLMRGYPLSSIERGVGQNDNAVIHIKFGTKPALEDNPCINCGLCVNICPMRLRPNMLSRYAEFEQYNNCHKEYIELCIECGLCGYVCPSCRPMQQYFRIANHQLGIISRQHTIQQPL